MDERAKRIGRNEAAFRRANEQIRGVAESFSMVAERTDFVCECGSINCSEPIALTAAEYERVRSNPVWFVVKHGHAAEDVERVVEEHATYAIIEKHPGGPAGFAIREDDNDERE